MEPIKKGFRTFGDAIGRSQTGVYGVYETTPTQEYTYKIILPNVKDPI